MYKVHRWIFHWKFWNPQRSVIGGPIRFGWYAVVKSDDGSDVMLQSAWQVKVKRDMGLTVFDEHR